MTPREFWRRGPGRWLDQLTYADFGDRPIALTLLIFFVVVVSAIYGIAAAEAEEARRPVPTVTQTVYVVPQQITPAVTSTPTLSGPIG